MEITAAIEALKALKKKSFVIITTDSTYLKDGITSWIKNWKRNGWKTKEKKLVKNIDLWKTLDALMFKHTVEWRWVRGHAGHRENEIVDRIVKNEIKQLIKELKSNSQESFDLF